MSTCPTTPVTKTVSEGNINEWDYSLLQVPSPGAACAYFHFFFHVSNWTTPCLPVFLVSSLKCDALTFLESGATWKSLQVPTRFSLLNAE